MNSRTRPCGITRTALGAAALAFGLALPPAGFAADATAPPPPAPPPVAPPTPPTPPTTPPVAPPTPPVPPAPPVKPVEKTPAERTVEVVVYYQPQDSHWSDAQKAIDKVAAQFKTAHFTRVNVSTPAGAAALKEFEEKHKVTEHGDLTVSVDGAVIVSSGDTRTVEKTLEYACTRATAGLPAHKGKVTAPVSTYAQEIFGKGVATALVEHPDGELDIEYFAVTKDGALLGWVANAYFHIKCPVCNDSQFLAAVRSPAVMLLDLRPVRALELRGTPLSPKVINDFIAQFKNRTVKDNKDVDGISGATKSSDAYEKLVGELLDHLAQKQKKQEKSDKEKTEKSDKEKEQKLKDAREKSKDSH